MTQIFSYFWTNNGKLDYLKFKLDKITKIFMYFWNYNGKLSCCCGMFLYVPYLFDLDLIYVKTLFVKPLYRFVKTNFTWNEIRFLFANYRNYIRSIIEESVSTCFVLITHKRHYRIGEQSITPPNTKVV